MQMVTDLADRMHELNDGRTLASGTPEKGAEQPSSHQRLAGGARMAGTTLALERKRKVAVGNDRN